MIYTTYAGKIIELADPKTGMVRVQGLKTGRWAHAQAPGGILEVTTERIKRIYDNFKKGVIGKELPTNLNHDDKNFTLSRGWIQDMEIVKGEDGSDELDLIVDPTPETKTRIQNKEIKFFSPELLLGYKPKDGSPETDVMRGGAWTNVPYLKGMRSAVLNLADIEDAPEDEDSSASDDPDAPERTKNPSLSEAKDADAKSEDLPDQCRSCKLLFAGTCPFMGVETKEAAAGDGTCPRFEPNDVVQETPDPNKEGNMPTKEEEAATNLAELQTTVTTLNEKLESNTAMITALSELLEAEKLKTRAIQTDAVRVKDGIFLSELIDKGVLTGATVSLAERILIKSRGTTTGVIQLSELSGDAEIKLDETTLEADVKELLREINPQVSLSESEYVQLAMNKGEVDLSELIDKKAADLAKERMVPLTTPGLYGEAARLASDEFSQSVKKKNRAMAGVR